MPALEIPTVDQRTLSKYLIRQIQVHKVAKKKWGPWALSQEAN